MANRWDHRARTYEGYAGCQQVRTEAAHSRGSRAEQHADPAFEVEPRYWMDAERR